MTIPALVAIWLAIAASAAAAEAPVTVTVDTRRAGYAIPDDFVGLSFGAVTELPDEGGVGGRLFSPQNRQLIALFRNSGIRNLRLGGSTVDGPRAALPTHADIDSVFAFAQAAGVRVIYSVRLLNGSPDEAAATAKYVWDDYRGSLAYFAIGNEPDHYRPGTDPAITGYPSYLAAWRRFAAAVVAAVPGATFVGPDPAGPSWTVPFARDAKASGRVSVITQHFYVGGNPYKRFGPQGLAVPRAIDEILSKDWPDRKYPSLYGKVLSVMAAEGLPYRLTESNDYVKGVPGASDAFVAALWALDYLHWWAAHGCSGVNFHNTEWLPTDTVFLGPARTFQIAPKAYAIRAFDVGSRGRTEPLSLANPDGIDLTAYAVRGAGFLYVTLINKEHGSGAHDARVTVTADGIAPDAAVMRLVAPSGDPTAKAGITLGGGTIDDRFPWRGAWTPLPPPPPASARSKSPPSPRRSSGLPW